MRKFLDAFWSVALACPTAAAFMAAVPLTVLFVLALCEFK